MAQDVGPILEMVTERYLLRSALEWQGRQDALSLFDQIVAQLKKGDIRAIGTATHQNFTGPIQSIISLGVKSVYGIDHCARAIGIRE